MKSLFVLIFFTALANKFCNAQIMQIVAGNTGTYDGVHTNDLLLLSQSEVIDLDNADISGNPFWSEDWKTALLYTDKYEILVSKVKLNLYKNDVWFTTPQGVTMIAKTGTVKGITFFNGDDTTDVLANFVYLTNEDDKDYRYYQFMNAGKAQLVKLNSVTVYKHPFDPFIGKSELNYVPKTEYYLYYHKFFASLKDHYKEAIFTTLRPGDSAIEWLNKHNNRLKSISDILNFLEYFNATK
jgi:hypothetical protein